MLKKIFWGDDPDFPSNKIWCQSTGKIPETFLCFGFQLPNFDIMGDITSLIGQLVWFWVTGEFSPLYSPVPVFCTYGDWTFSLTESSFAFGVLLLWRLGIPWKSFSYHLLVFGSWKFGVPLIYFPQLSSHVPHRSPPFEGGHCIGESLCGPQRKMFLHFPSLGPLLWAYYLPYPVKICESKLVGTCVFTDLELLGI